MLVGDDAICVSFLGGSFRKTVQIHETTHKNVNDAIGVGGLTSATNGAKIVANLEAKFAIPIDVTEKSVGNILG